MDFVVEAVPERMEIKQAVFSELDEATPGHAILASNTSSLSITEMAEATLRPDKVCGFHFFYPASMMRLIEVIEGDDTSDETLQAASNFAQALRKTAVRCGEVPGFVVNRILTSAMSEVWRVTEDEELDVKDVDKAIQESGTVPMGPVLPDRPARARHGPPRGGAPARLVRRALPRVEADEGAGGGGEPRPEDREGVL